ncbi:quinone oxidoreductase family protein [Streptomyces sp. NPDC020799]|uniref:quinone oxidoreductase family protein n=1 Tax=Streptomyces sp. NPDC020799 TaxID=3365091 RepID=UPI0037A5CCC5
MRAIVVTQHGGPEVLTLAELPDPAPGPGEVVARPSAVGVNFKDIYEREGRAKPAPPFIPGSEGAGTVTAVGEGVTSLAPGDRIAWCAAPGSYAEQVVVPARAAVPLPADITDEDAAALLLQGLTAHYLTTSTHPAREGDTALVHAAAGGVGRLLTQVLTRHGVRVVATASTPDKAADARRLGAWQTLVTTGGTDIAARVREMTGGRGVDVVYDGVGRDTFEAGLKSLRPRGTFVLFGESSGPVDGFAPRLLAAHGSLFLTRPTLNDHATDPAELLERTSELFAWLRSGAIGVRVGGRYALEEAARAHGDLQERRSTGKLLLTP